MTAVLCSALSGCTGEQQGHPVTLQLPREYEGYKQLIIATVKRNRRKAIAVDGRDIPFFEDPAVVTLYRRANEVAGLAWQLLIDDSVQLEVRQYQGRMLQCLPLSDYVLLLDRANAALAAGELDSEVVATLIAPGPEWGAVLYLSYQNPALREAVDRMAENSRATPGLRERIHSLVSGEQAAFVKEYGVPNEPLPRISCNR